jgi:peroxiredoxin
MLTPVTEFQDQYNRQLQALLAEGSVLLCFLRHNGCVMTRKTLAYLKAQHPWLEQQHCQLILIHMDTQTNANRLFERYQLETVSAISDPTGKLYEAAGFQQRGILKNFGFPVLVQAIKAVFEGHKGGLPTGQVLRMQGFILLEKGLIIKQYEYNHAGDQLDIINFITN